MCRIFVSSCTFPYCRFVHIFALLFCLSACENPSSQPKIAIASWGPHETLDDTIRGIQQGLQETGFVPEKNVLIKVQHVNFEPGLIRSMIAQLRSEKPTIFVALSTPVVQAAKAQIKQIPLLLVAVTDPVEAGLSEIPGVTDKQDFSLILTFIHDLLPQAKRVGVLFSTGEANDQALVHMLKKAAHTQGFQIMAQPVDHARDIPLRMQAFQGKVDVLYVGTSVQIQPALPAIVAQADRMNIPIINAGEKAVQNHMVLASFGVNYVDMGRRAGYKIAQILKDPAFPKTAPENPRPEDHRAFVSLKRMKRYGLQSCPSYAKGVS